ncbi:MAG: NAD(P)/FAD-dependent oxidoreductase [Cyclobacteriaceae bacterium]|nr:NAD(P)/FAD-dependent oxidoreductase [Cyclobacteriaceae bacterium]
MKKTIAIIGGGIGGIVIANKLRNTLPDHVRIMLLEQNKMHTFAASYLWLMVGQRTTDNISMPLNRLVDKGVDTVFEEVKSIDTSANRIKTSAQTISYDYLILSPGADLDRKYLNRSGEGIHDFYTFEGTQKLLEALNEIGSGEIVLAIEAMPYKCPGAPYEAAMLIKDHMNKRGLSGRINVNLYTPEPQPLPVAGPELGNSVSRLLEKKGIRFFPNHRLSEVNPGEKKIGFDNGREQSYDLLIVVPKHNPPAFLANSGLTDESGWVPVDKSTLQTRAENVYAIGDTTSVSIPGKWQNDKPMKLPKAGVFAHGQALVVADLIEAKILGKKTAATFCGDGFCMLEAGEDLAGFAYGDFFAEPNPQVKMKNLGRLWHFGKVLFEKWWLSPAGIRKTLYQNLLLAGGRLLGIPIKL